MALRVPSKNMELVKVNEAIGISQYWRFTDLKEIECFRLTPDIFIYLVLDRALEWGILCTCVLLVFLFLFLFIKTYWGIADVMIMCVCVCVCNYQDQDNWKFVSFDLHHWNSNGQPYLETTTLYSASYYGALLS